METFKGGAPGTMRGPRTWTKLEKGISTRAHAGDSDANDDDEDDSAALVVGVASWNMAW